MRGEYNLAKRIWGIILTRKKKKEYEVGPTVGENGTSGEDSIVGIQ